MQPINAFFYTLNQLVSKNSSNSRVMSMPSCDETRRSQRPHFHQGQTSRSSTHTRRRFATPPIY
ncbi:hypothetical protein Hanom_Chr08g00719521 [Helianthus anomalus]